MKQYRDLLIEILSEGEIVKNDRTGVGTISTFGKVMRFNLEDGFPAVTGKSLAFKSVVSELLWFLEGSTDERRLAELHYNKERSDLIGKNTIWTANADAQGVALGYENTDTVKQLGPVYGKQWVNWNGVDQIAQLVKDLKQNPYSRRHILNAWNVSDIPSMALPPCHMFAQFKVTQSGKLDCIMYMRSADSTLGVPFNIASYSLLTIFLAREVGLRPGVFTLMIGDAHIYLNHMDAVKEYLENPTHDLPLLEIDPDFVFRSASKYNLDDSKKIRLLNYVNSGKIFAEMAV